MSKKTGHVPATFTDAGTGQTFEGGQEHNFDRGAYENYAAAGLVEAPKVKLAAPRANKPAARKSASKPATAAPATDTATKA